MILIRDLCPVVRITRRHFGTATKISRGEREDGIEEHRACHGQVGNRDGKMVEGIIQIELAKSQE